MSERMDDEEEASSQPVTSPGDATDWQTVFDHPEHGLITTVANAKNLRELKHAVLDGIEKLFTRETDKAQVLIFISRLEKIFAYGDFEGAQGAVKILLRNIKELRQKKTAEYQEKNTETPPEKGQERRVKDDQDGGLSFAPLELLNITPKESKYLLKSFSVTLLACILIALAVYGVMQFLG
jgi:hypothetical protein